MKKKPLTEKDLVEIEKKIKKDPKLKNALSEDFEKTIESMGYSLTKEFFDDLDKRIEKVQEKDFAELEKQLKKKRKKPIKVEVKIDSKKKTRKVRILEG